MHICAIEINMLMHLPFMGAGIRFEAGENQLAVQYQAAHHELVASALATKLAHEIDPNCQVGCMIAAGSVYPYSCRPEDVWQSMQKDRETYFFTDVQARGAYPSYAKKLWECKSLDSFAGLVLHTVYAGDMAFGKASFFVLHLAQLISRKLSRYPCLQPLQVFSNSRKILQ